MVGRQRIDVAEGQARPEGVHVRLLPQGRRAGVLRAVLFLEPLAGQVQVDRAGLDVDGNAAAPPVVAGFEGPGAREVDDVARTPRRLGEPDGAVRGHHFRLHRPRVGKELRVGLAGFPQHAAAAVHDGGVLAVDERDATVVLRDPHRGQELPHVPVEVVEGQEELDGRVARFVERGDAGQVLFGRPHEHGMQEVVGHGEGARVGVVLLYGVGDGPVPGREAHVADGGDAAGQGRPRAGFEVVRPVPVRVAADGVRQVHVGVDAARGHDVARRVDLPPAARGGHPAAELRDRPVANAHVDDGAAPDRDHVSATHDQVHRSAHCPATTSATLL